MLAFFYPKVCVRVHRRRTSFLCASDRILVRAANNVHVKKGYLNVYAALMFIDCVIPPCQQNEYTLPYTMFCLMCNPLLTAVGFLDRAYEHKELK